MVIEICQWPISGFGPLTHLTVLEEAEIIPGKRSDTKIKPLAFTNGQAVTYNRYKFVTVSLPKRFRNGRFTSETAVRRFQ